MDLWPLLIPVAYFGVILLATWLAAWIVSVAIGRSLSRSTPLVTAQARQAGWVLVWVVGVIVALQQIGIGLEILLLVLALSGAGFIVAMRSPLENIAAKYFSNVYVAFDLGDTISVQGVSGTVVEVNPMATIIMAADDTLLSIPNSTFMHEIVVNTTPQAWKRVTTLVVLPTEVDLPSFEHGLLKNLGKLRHHLDERFPPSLAVKSRGPQSTELILTVMIRDPGKRDAIVTEVNGLVTKLVGAGKSPR